jgi:hypothetical protein
MAVAVLLAIPVIGSGGMQERPTSLAAVEDGNHWTLVHPSEVCRIGRWSFHHHFFSQRSHMNLLEIFKEVYP